MEDRISGLLERGHAEWQAVAAAFRPETARRLHAGTVWVNTLTPATTWLPSAASRTQGQAGTSRSTRWMATPA